MAETFFQVPPDSTGKKIRTRDRVIGANTVHEQAVYQAALPTYYALADTVAFAVNKHHISLMNAVGSGKVYSIRKIFHINLSLAAVTGVAVRFDVKKATAVSAGTAITAQSVDTDNPALVGLTINTNGTVSEGALLYPVTTQNDEIAASNAAVANYLMQSMNLQPEGMELQELRLRPGEGMTVKQITSTTVGSFAWLVVFTMDDDV
jgi:hypothetical protein